MEQAIRVYERLKGPVVPVNVCFTSDDSLDYVATRKYVGWVCEQEVPVILRQVPAVPGYLTGGRRFESHLHYLFAGFLG